jgi:hypothetical protein
MRIWQDEKNWSLVFVSAYAILPNINPRNIMSPWVLSVTTTLRRTTTGGSLVKCLEEAPNLHSEKEGYHRGTHLFGAGIKKSHLQELPIHVSPKKYFPPSLLSDTLFAGPPGHGGVEGRPMRKPDRCCRSGTPIALKA